MPQCPANAKCLTLCHSFISNARITIIVQEITDTMKEPTEVPSALNKIWFIVAMIPEGAVINYGKVADLAGLPGRARYVSRALKLAPQHMQLPWHRVINSQGKISFKYGSEGYQLQQSRLREEGIKVNKGKISLSEYEWRPDIATLVMSIPF